MSYLKLMAGASMAAGLCCHFLGNELARAATVSLISAKETGLDSSALTYTVAFGCPASALTLYAYTTSIRKYGTHTTFTISSIISLSIFIMMTYAASSGVLHNSSLLSKIIIVAFYSFREIHATLVSTQLWAFIVSVLDNSTSSYIVTFSGAISIASTIGGFLVEQVVIRYGVVGLLFSSSIACSGTMMVSELGYHLYSQYTALKTKEITKTSSRENLHTTVTAVKDTTHKAHDKDAVIATATAAAVKSHSPVSPESNGTFVSSNNTTTSSASSPASTAPVTPAVTVSSVSGSATIVPAIVPVVPAVSAVTEESNPQKLPRKHSIDKVLHPHKASSSAAAAGAGGHHHHHHHHHKQQQHSIWQESIRLLSNTTLKLLVMEAIVHQCCANIQHIIFYDGIRAKITNDDDRAVTVGRFFASVNMTACFLQFFIIPRIMSPKTLPTIIVITPVLIAIVGGICTLWPSLLAVMLTFGCLKVLEYAVLAGAMEMIYMPLDSETRYLGKEYVRFFGSKMGKTGASLVFSAMTSYLKPSLTFQCFWGWIFALSWSVVMVFLAVHLREKIDASSLVSEKSVEKTGSTAAAAAAVVPATATTTAAVSHKPVPHHHHHHNDSNDQLIKSAASLVATPSFTTVILHAEPTIEQKQMLQQKQEQEHEAKEEQEVAEPVVVVHHPSVVISSSGKSSSNKSIPFSPTTSSPQSVVGTSVCSTDTAPVQSPSSPSSTQMAVPKINMKINMNMLTPVKSQTSSQTNLASDQLTEPPPAAAAAAAPEVVTSDKSTKVSTLRPQLTKLKIPTDTEHDDNNNIFENESIELDSPGEKAKQKIGGSILASPVPVRNNHSSSGSNSNTNRVDFDMILHTGRSSIAGDNNNDDVEEDFSMLRASVSGRRKRAKSLNMGETESNSYFMFAYEMMRQNDLTFSSHNLYALNCLNRSQTDFNSVLVAYTPRSEGSDSGSISGSGSSRQPEAEEAEAEEEVCTTSDDSDTSGERDATKTLKSLPNNNSNGNNSSSISSSSSSSGLSPSKLNSSEHLNLGSKHRSSKEINPNKSKSCNNNIRMSSPRISNQINTLLCNNDTAAVSEFNDITPINSPRRRPFPICFQEYQNMIINSAHSSMNLPILEETLHDSSSSVSISTDASKSPMKSNKMYDNSISGKSISPLHHDQLVLAQSKENSAINGFFANGLRFRKKIPRSLSS